MYTTRQVKRLESVQNRPFQVSLDYFKKQTIEPIMRFQQSIKQQSGRIVLRDKQNCVLVAVAFLHVTSRIAAKRSEELQNELNSDMKQADLLQLSKTPEEHDAHLHSQTLTAALLCAIQRVDIAAQEHGYRLPAVRREFGQLLNMHPYLKFALVVWLRCRTLTHLKQNQHKYLEAMGNEQALLTNYTSEIRGVPLEMVCNCISMRLEVGAGSAVEQFGRMVDTQASVEHHLRLQGPLIIISEQGESDQQTDTTTWSSQKVLSKYTKSIASEAPNLLSIETPTFTVSAGESSGRCIKCLKHCRCAIDRKTTRRDCRSPNCIPKVDSDKSSQAYSNRKNVYRLGDD